MPATLGNPGAIRIGSEAYVVGNPFGLYGSISAGVVSVFDRRTRDRDERSCARRPHPGRRCRQPRQLWRAPCWNRDGQVVGIVAALLNPTKGDCLVGIGLAVPIDVAGGAAGLPPY